MPRIKTVAVEFLDRPRVAHYGLPQYREICKLLHIDVTLSQDWFTKATSGDLDTAFQVLHVLLREDDPSLTIEQIAESFMPDLATRQEMVDLFAFLETGKRTRDFAQESASPFPLSSTNAPSVESTSA